MAHDEDAVYTIDTEGLIPEENVALDVNKSIVQAKDLVPKAEGLVLKES